MKGIYTLLIGMILCATAGAAYQPGAGVGTLTVGGLPMTTTGLKILHASHFGGAGSVFYDVSLGLTTRAAYTPSGSNKFALYAAVFSGTSSTGVSTGGVPDVLVCCTNNIGNDSATACTTPIGMMTGDTVTTNKADAPFGQFASVPNGGPLPTVAIGGSCANGKYPTVIGSAGTGNWTIYGYEVP